jgi:FkbM family methyltransferase
LKALIKTFARSLGVEIRKSQSLELEHNRLTLMLAAHGVDLVLDIGANTGQWAQQLRRAGYGGDMISFEPLSSAHEQLTRNARNDPRWKIAPRFAIGSSNGDAKIHVSGNSYSSSILPMLPAHVAGAPDSQYVGIEHTPMRTLDSLIGETIPADRTKIFCKLDVQGYEASILAGAEALLTRTVGLQMEISLTPLYEGAPSFRQLLDLMERSGFEAYGFVPGFVDPQSGRMLQMDGVFFRNSHRAE